MPTKKLTVGLEVEAVEVTPESHSLETEYGFQRHFDRTIRGPNGEELPRETAAELLTRPMSVEVAIPQVVTPIRLAGESAPSNPFQALGISYGDTEGVVKALCRCVSKVNKSCGIHVHVGNPNRGDRSDWSGEQIQTWITVAYLLEERLFSLVPTSRIGNQYCKKITESYSSSDFKLNCPVGPVVARKYGNTKRYCWLNLIETKRQDGIGTVEIRMLGNTKRFEYIWAWTKLWLKIGSIIAFWPASQAIMALALSDLLDQDFIEVKRIKDIPENRRTGVNTPVVNIQPRIRRADGRA